MHILAYWIYIWGGSVYKGMGLTVVESPAIKPFRGLTLRNRIRVEGTLYIGITDTYHQGYPTTFNQPHIIIEYCIMTYICKYIYRDCENSI